MGSPEQRTFTPRLIAWEVTRSCPLHCKHCRGAARSTVYPNELSTDECFKLLDNIASFAKPIIILTGGEPMLRRDIYDIAAYASGMGLRVVMAPCGALISDETAAKISRAGIRHISISLDGATAKSHDAFRGVDGAFASALRGIEATKRAGLSFQINTTVTKDNLDELEDILKLAAALGASVFNPFLLVPAGRGKALANLEISPEQYEETLRWLAGRQNRGDIQIRVTCAPHYQRIIRQLGVHPSKAHAVKGCMGGQSFAFVSHVGKVQICGFLDVEAGDVRKENFDFRKIWETSELFLQIRDVKSYGGRCGYCEFAQVCGGCRARAYALTGDYLGEEPFCVYQPKRRPADDKSEGAAKLDAMDKKILSVIQTELPVCARPFEALARRVGADPERIMARISRLYVKGFIRRIGPIFDSGRLGYVSTLVAARVSPERLDEVSALVSRLPEVTHNYRRKHVYNLWFTVTAESTEKIQRILDNLRQQTGINDFRSLPALAVYKTRVNFRLDEEFDAPEVDPGNRAGEPVKLDESQKALVRLLGDDLPLVPEPFAELARRLGWLAQRVLEQISDWLEAGVIRRFGAAVHHRALGFRSNGMAVFCVPVDGIDAAGKHLARYTEVTHCYQRAPFRGWKYNLFAMVHGRSEDEVNRFVARAAAELELPDYTVLFSDTEYKKTSMRYFVEASEPDTH